MVYHSPIKFRVQLVKVINSNLTILFISALIILLRVPSLITTPRFYAEEGTLYFATSYFYSHTNEWYKGITQLQVGYFSLWPNIANTIAANLVNLKNAPLVVTFFAFCIQLLPTIIILWGKS
jgi:hypothetical protein